MIPIITTLVYCVRDGRTLLLKRRKPPFAGYWVAPGGKVESGEAPIDCARRELWEETSLKAERLALRGVVAETSARPDWQWLLFIYRVDHFTGEPHSPTETLQWWRIDDLSSAELPESDRLFAPRILGADSSLYEARYEYDESLNLTSVKAYIAGGLG